MAEEMKTLIDGIATAFKEYKQTNDERLALLEKGQGAGQETEKLERLEEKLQELELAKGDLEAKFNRSQKPDEKDVKAREHSEAFMSFVRKGDVTKLDRMAAEQKDMNTIIGEDGGYAVPQNMAGSILKMLGDDTPMRGILGHITTNSEDYSQLVDRGDAGAGWVGETDARPETSTTKLEQVKAIFGEIYANPYVTQRALDDIYFNVETHLSGKIAEAFATQENAAFTAGDGINKPKGLFAYDFVSTADASREYGKFQFVKSGAASTLGTTPGDVLITLQNTLKSGYKIGARWLLNQSTLTTLRQIKDVNGQYIWQPGLSMETPGTLLAFPYTLNPEMPSIAAGALPIAFGSFARAMAVVDRMGIRMLRDPYTKKPFVGFYTTKRVGTMLQDTQAVKAIKIAA